MRLEAEVRREAPPRRRYRYGSAPHGRGCISAAAYGLKASERGWGPPTLRLVSLRDRAKLARYFEALEAVLGADWLERPHTCTVADCAQLGRSVRLALPCIRFNCPNNLIGYLDGFGLPVIPNPRLAGRPICVLQLGAWSTLLQIADVFGISHERVRQIEETALERARLIGRRRGLVAGRWS